MEWISASLIISPTLTLFFFFILFFARSNSRQTFYIQASVSLRFCASSDSDRWWMQEATGCNLYPVLKMIFLTHKWNRRHLFPSSQFQLASCTKRNRRLGTYHSRLRLEDLGAQIRKQLRLTTDKRALRRTDSYFRKRLHFEKASLLCNYPHARAVYGERTTRYADQTEVRLKALKKSQPTPTATPSFLPVRTN